MTRVFVHRGLLVAAAIVLVGTIPLLSSQGQAVAGLAVEGATYEASLVRAETTGDGSSRFHFDIREAGEGEPSTFVLQNLTTEIRKLGLYRDTLLVFGSVGNAGQGVTLVDLQRRREVDFILAYYPRHSLTGRYLIYRKFYPRFAPPEVQSDLVLVYDLARSPRENRLGGEASPVAMRAGSPEHLVASQEVGFPIYPLPNVRDRSYRVWVEEPAERHLVTTGFLWDRQDERVLFVDREGERQEDSVVVVDLSDGLERPKVAKLPLTESSFQGVDPAAPTDAVTNEKSDEGENSGSTEPEER